jgi:5-methylcytosine-specific restriction protein A
VEAISPFWTWATLKSWVERRDKATCQRCRTTDPPKPNHGGWSGRTDPWDVDHIVPVADGGTDDPLNLRLLCIPCHVAVGYEQRGARRDDDSDQQVLPLEGAA